MKRNQFSIMPLRRIFLALALLLALALNACTLIVEPGPPPVPPAPATPTPAPESMAPAALLGTWQWEAAVLNGESVTVADPSRYTLTFQADGSVAARLDCNSGGGSYRVEGDSLTIEAMTTTLMACPPDSQDWEFSAGLSDVVGYAIDGETLTLLLGTEGDSMTFSRVE